METLADLLVQAVHGQWRKAAIERLVMTPAPISIHWLLSSLPVTGELTAGARDKVALILDGLDEMDEVLRPIGAAYQF